MPAGPSTPRLEGVEGLVAPSADPVALERQGRRWLLWSFLLCPCHLPLSLGVLTAVLAGTSLGALVRDHLWVAGAVLTVTWAVGTGYGFRLVRRAQRAGGACPARPGRQRPASSLAGGAGQAGRGRT